MVIAGGNEETKGGENPQDIQAEYKIQQKLNQEKRDQRREQQFLNIKNLNYRKAIAEFKTRSFLMPEN